MKLMALSFMLLLFTASNVFPEECLSVSALDLDLESNTSNFFNNEGTGVSIAREDGGIKLYDINHRLSSKEKLLEEIGAISNEDMRLVVAKNTSLVDILLFSADNKERVIRFSVLPGSGAVFEKPGSEHSFL